jgi:hypothetical protein
LDCHCVFESDTKEVQKNKTPHNHISVLVAQKKVKTKGKRQLNKNITALCRALKFQCKL